MTKDQAEATEKSKEIRLKPQKSRPEMRFDREAKALQKNLEKRKKQKQVREDTKVEK